MGIYQKHNKGFTIVELMIATTVFSIILVVASVGVIAIGRAYYKSATSTRVQETARSIVSDVSSSLQFSNKETIAKFPDDATPAIVKSRCFGTDRYTYVLNQKVEGSTHALYRDRRPIQEDVPDGGSSPENVCPPSDFSTNGTELLGENMRLLQFDVSNSNPFSIKIRIAYGDDDLLTVYDNQGQPIDGSVTESEAASALCKSGIAGSNFCAVSGLETTVTSRVK